MPTKRILTRIISDCAAMCGTIKRIGVTGSYARGDYAPNSDIDLVLDNGFNQLDEGALSMSLRIKKILYDQFRKETDFILYSTILKSKEQPKGLYEQMGYQQMYEDLIWLWETA